MKPSTTFEETKALLDQSNFYYIICTNMEGKYSYVNQHYTDTFAGIHGPLLDQPYHITMHPDDTKVCREVADKCFRNPDRMFPATIRKCDGKGGYVVTQWEYKAIFDADNQPAGIFCLGYDITEYKLQQEKLASAHQLIHEKEVIFREIAWNQSHVLRRPLANILGLTMVLEKMDLDQNLRNICGMLIESSRQLDEVIRETVSKTN